MSKDSFAADVPSKKKKLVIVTAALTALVLIVLAVVAGQRLAALKTTGLKVDGHDDMAVSRDTTATDSKKLGGDAEVFTMKVEKVVKGDEEEEEEEEEETDTDLEKEKKKVETEEEEAGEDFCLTYFAPFVWFFSWLGFRPASS